jgi:hypothetical protein
MIRSIPLALLLANAAAAGADVSVAADAAASVEPNFPAVFVAKLVPSDPPPPPPLPPGYCNPCDEVCPSEREEETICFDPPVAWYSVHLQSVLAGPPLPSRFFLSLGLHRGPAPPARDDSKLWLVKASRETPEPDYTDGTLLYGAHSSQVEPLHVSRWGEPYLLLHDNGTEVVAPTWLPCSVNALREEVAASDFPGAWRPLAELDGFERDDIEAGVATYLHVDERGAAPRYGIALRRLREHLESLGKLDDDAMRCEPPDPEEQP